MKLPHSFRDLPTRLATGAYILHAGLGKWSADDAHAAALHQMASNAFPFLKGIPPSRFGRLLAGGEIATGAALLTPVVPAGLAGAALTVFSGALVGMYLRTPTMHNPGSIWPSPQGIGISKDVWMLGIGLGLMVEAATER